MLLHEFKAINEMAGITPWTRIVRDMVVANPNVTDVEIGQAVAKAGAAEPANVKSRISWLRKEVAKKAGGVSPAPKPGVTNTTPPAPKPRPSTVVPPAIAPSAPVTPSALAPTPTDTVVDEPVGNDTDHLTKIEVWLTHHNVKDFTVDPATYVVDVDGDVRLIDKFYHDALPVRFGTVKGDFSIAGTGVTSLHGCPAVVEGSFHAGGNSPHGKNKGLKSATGSPTTVHGSADYEDCPLASIDGLPREIGEDLDLTNTKITDFAGINRKVKKIGGNLILGKSVDSITGSIAGLVLIRGLKSVTYDMTGTKAAQAFKIVNKHLAGDRSGPDCMLEMQDAGLYDFAEL